MMAHNVRTNLGVLAISLAFIATMPVDATLLERLKNISSQCADLLGADQVAMDLRNPQESLSAFLTSDRSVNLLIQAVEESNTKEGFHFGKTIRKLTGGTQLATAVNGLKATHPRLSAQVINRVAAIERLLRRNPELSASAAVGVFQSLVENLFNFHAILNQLVRPSDKIVAILESTEPLTRDELSFLVEGKPYGLPSERIVRKILHEIDINAEIISGDRGGAYMGNAMQLLNLKKRFALKMLAYHAYADLAWLLTRSKRDLCLLSTFLDKYEKIYIPDFEIQYLYTPTNYLESMKALSYVKRKMSERRGLTCSAS